MIVCDQCKTEGGESWEEILLDGITRHFCTRVCLINWMVKQQLPDLVPRVEVAKTKTYTDEELRSFGALPRQTPEDTELTKLWFDKSPKTPEEPEWAKKEKLKDMSFGQEGVE